MRSEKGFSLVELLLVVAILGVISSMAISQYKNYKVRALDARAVASLRRLIADQENYFADNEQYANDTSLIVNWASDAQVTTAIEESDGAYWKGHSYHQAGSVRYCYQTNSGSAIEKVGGITTILGVATPCP